MNMLSAPPYEIVRIVDLQPPGETGFCVLIAPPTDADVAANLQKEFASQLSVKLSVIDSRGLSVAALIGELRKLPRGTLLIHGLEDWSNDQFVSLDVQRSQLETGAFLLFKTDPATLGRFFQHAPNLRSFIGANIFVVAPDFALMSQQETAERLDQLRSYYHLTDEELLQGARNGTLPAEPHFAEWLVLMGSGEFVR